MIRYLTISFISALFFCRPSFAQDIHFSQFDGAPLNISPAFCGFFDGEYRFSAIYRTQWQAVPVTYNTFNMNAETRQRPLFLRRDAIGLGLSFYNDKAGDASYGSTQLFLQGAYHYLPANNEKLRLSAGLNMGWCRVGFDYSKMTFDNQYSGSQLIPGAASGEQLNRTRTGYFDLNLGALGAYQFTESKSLSLAIGLHHLSGPKISYMGNDLSKLDFKFSNLVTYRSRIGQRSHGLAEALIAVQGKNLEIIPHLGLIYDLDEDLNRNISAGLCLRTSDALIVRLGYQYKNFRSGISYDINLSQFQAASNLRGGFEIFLSQVLSSKKPFSSQKRICPVFM